MTWTKLDDEFDEDTADLSDAAFRLHVNAIVRSNRRLLDGRIPKVIVGSLVPKLRPAAIAELVAGGWWRDEGTAYQLLRGLQDQPTSTEVEAQRKVETLRKAVGRAKSAGHDASALEAALADARRRLEDLRASRLVPPSVPPVVPLGHPPDDHRASAGSPAAPDPTRPDPTRITRAEQDVDTSNVEYPGGRVDPRKSPREAVA